MKIKFDDDELSEVTAALTAKITTLATLSGRMPKKHRGRLEERIARIKAVLSKIEEPSL